MLGRLFGMCMVFNIQWAGLAFSKYLLFLSFIYADFFFLLVTDNQSVRYPEKKYAVILKKEGVFLVKICRCFNEEKALFFHFTVFCG